MDARGNKLSTSKIHYKTFRTSATLAEKREKIANTIELLSQQKLSSCTSNANNFIHQGDVATYSRKDLYFQSVFWQFFVQILYVILYTKYAGKRQCKETVNDT